MLPFNEVRLLVKDDDVVVIESYIGIGADTRSFAPKESSRSYTWSNGRSLFNPKAAKAYQKTGPSPFCRTFRRDKSCELSAGHNCEKSSPYRTRPFMRWNSVASSHDASI